MFACASHPTDPALRRDTANHWLRLAGPVRGWVRRLAPPDWQRGVVLESHEAALKTAWLSLLSAIIRTTGVHWLTELETLISSENKMVQYTAATAAGALTPKTVVCSDAATALRVVGEPLVLKPLGPGHFYEQGLPHVLHTSEAASDAPELAALDTVPFIAQERLGVRRHLRVVTVRRHCWAAALDARGVPLDWRGDTEAHGAFEPTETPQQVREAALRLTALLRLGYSSQDWVETADSYRFLDLNPSGQWLFLPEPVARQVTSAVAAWLRAEDL
jgi:glutathione synthase/RimK-type ligase-like ATP-grasp enzyme